MEVTMKVWALWAFVDTYWAYLDQISKMVFTSKQSCRPMFDDSSEKQMNRHRWTLLIFIVNLITCSSVLVSSNFIKRLNRCNVEMMNTFELNSFQLNSTPVTDSEKCEELEIMFWVISWPEKKNHEWACEKGYQNDFTWLQYLLQQEAN